MRRRSTRIPPAFVFVVLFAVTGSLAGASPAAAQTPPPAAATADVEAALEWLASTSAGAL